MMWKSFSDKVLDRLGLVYGNLKVKLTNNPVRGVLYIAALLGVGASQVENWLKSTGADWFVEFHDWVATLIEPIPGDLAPMTLVGLVLALVGADAGGRFAQRFTEPRKAYDEMLHRYLSDHLEDGEEEKDG